MNIPFLAITNLSANHTLMILLISVIVVLALWDGVWKLIAMWKSARNQQLGWFICLALINSVGILPILYILLFQKSEKRAELEPPKV